MYNYRKAIGDVTTLPLEQTQSRALRTPSAGEDLEQLELWFTTNRWK